MKTIRLSDEDYRLIEETLRLDSESHTMAAGMRAEIAAARERMISSVRLDGRRVYWISEPEAEVLDTPPSDWDNLATQLIAAGGNRMAKVSGGLSSTACWVARAAGYFNGRDKGKGHRDSVRESNRVITAARKALGYAYPDKGNLSF